MIAKIILITKTIFWAQKKYIHRSTCSCIATKRNKKARDAKMNFHAHSSYEPEYMYSDRRHPSSSLPSEYDSNYRRSFESYQTSYDGSIGMKGGGYCNPSPHPSYQSGSYDNRDPLENAGGSFSDYREPILYQSTFPGDDYDYNRYYDSFMNDGGGPSYNSASHDRQQPPSSSRRKSSRRRIRRRAKSVEPNGRSLRSSKSNPQPPSSSSNNISPPQSTIYADYVGAVPSSSHKSVGDNQTRWTDPEFYASSSPSAKKKRAAFLLSKNPKNLSQRFRVKSKRGGDLRDGLSRSEVTKSIMSKVARSTKSSSGNGGNMGVGSNGNGKSRGEKKGFANFASNGVGGGGGMGGDKHRRSKSLSNNLKSNSNGGGIPSAIHTPSSGLISTGLSSGLGSGLGPDMGYIQKPPMKPKEKKKFATWKPSRKKKEEPDEDSNFDPNIPKVISMTDSPPDKGGKNRSNSNQKNSAEAVTVGDEMTVDTSRTRFQCTDIDFEQDVQYALAGSCFIAAASALFFL